MGGQVQNERSLREAGTVLVTEWQMPASKLPVGVEPLVNSGTMLATTDFFQRKWLQGGLQASSNLQDRFFHRKKNVTSQGVKAVIDVKEKVHLLLLLRNQGPVRRVYPVEH